jgi:hypothetical protein
MAPHENVTQLHDEVELSALDTASERPPMPALFPPRRPKQKVTPIKAPVFALLFGAVLPIIAVLVEEGTRICASSFFDPLPTVWHILLYLLIPVATIAVLLVERGAHPRWVRAVGWLNGMAIGIAAGYSLIFLPIMPLAVLATLFMGMGLCGLSPAFGLIVGIRCRHYLSQTSTPLPDLWRGIVLGGLLLVIVEVPTAATLVGMSMTAATDPARSAHGMHLLRTMGSRRMLLDACYRDTRTGALLTGIFDLHPTSTEEARLLYYRVTGTPFNSQPRPLRDSARGFRDDTETDWDVGGSTVGGQAPVVSLTSSRLDGSLDSRAAVGYLEWTLEFANASRVAQEARLQIVLPPGAVVSRATLWVDGEPREAAFAARGRARRAYQEVAVVQRRDPLLVTTSGPDRILVQCFPIPPNGGAMKIRLGITTPLALDAADMAHCTLPLIAESNFPLTPSTRHAVWVESTGLVSSAQTALRPERTASGAFALRGAIPAATVASIRIRRDPQERECWTPDPLHPERIIRQQITTRPAQPPARLIVVLDGSRGMAESAGLALRLGALPTTDGAVLLASDTVKTLVPLGAWNETAAKRLTRALSTAHFDGGMENVPALIAAWELAAHQPHSAILWIHGPQPLSRGAEELAQRFTRRPDGPRLYTLQVHPGPNHLIEKLTGVAGVRVLPTGESTEALERLMREWAPGQASLVMHRDSAPRASARGAKTSQHLARLWAQAQALEFQQQQTPQSTELAIATASAYHLVTPVTGAVVLQTAQEFTEHGLEPAPPGSVPSVPEPEEWLLLLVVVGILGWLWWRGCGPSSRMVAA